MVMDGYKIVYADPPWTFATRSAKGKGKSPEQHYSCLSLQDIKSLPIENRCASECVLLLWTTGPHLQQAFEVIDAWGFEYKTIGFVWVKRTRAWNLLRWIKAIAGSALTSPMPKMWHWGCGYWTRANAEICLLATRGAPKRLSASVHQILDDPVGKHSAKPLHVRSKIVELLGDVPRIELFARDTSDAGWDYFGNEIDSSVAL